MAPILWQHSPNQPNVLIKISSLVGHKKDVGQLDFNQAIDIDENDPTNEEIITCSFDRVILWSVKQLCNKKVSRASRKLFNYILIRTTSLDFNYVKPSLDLLKH